MRRLARTFGSSARIQSPESRTAVASKGGRPESRVQSHAAALRESEDERVRIESSESVALGRRASDQGESKVQSLASTLEVKKSMFQVQNLQALGAWRKSAEFAKFAQSES